MPFPIYEKDPGDKLDFPVDFADVLATGDTLNSVTWTVPTGLIRDLALGGIVGQVATAYISGGTAGAYYTVECAGVSAGGVTKVQSIVIKVLEG